MKYKTRGRENSLKNPVNGGSVPVDAAGTGGMHQGSEPHMKSQDLPPTLQFPLQCHLPRAAGKKAWMDKENHSVESLEQQDRTLPAPHHLPGLPGSGRCSQHSGTYGSYKG